MFRTKNFKTILLDVTSDKSFDVVGRISSNKTNRYRFMVFFF